MLCSGSTEYTTGYALPRPASVLCHHHYQDDGARRLRTLFQRQQADLVT